MHPLARFLLPALALGIIAAAPAPVPLSEALKASRQPLRLEGSGLSGEGADTLRQAMARPRFIFVGEDHVTREIPRFVSALCDEVKPQALALEVGPDALAAVMPLLGARDRLARMAKFNRDYPSGIAFLDTRDDNDMAAHCLAAAKGRSFRLFGVDQEFLGAAGLILDRILATRLSAPARSSVLRLRALERQRSEEAAKTGNPADLLLIKATDAELSEAEALLAKGGMPAARALLAGLRISRDIYRMGGNEANLVRARLLKRNFSRFVPGTGKVIAKFGDWHAYQGFNPLGNRDLGNYVAELADGEGTPSLHILVLGAKGTHAMYAGYKRPLNLEPFTMTDDASYHWFKAAADIQLPGGGWTLFDLRPLKHARLTDMNPDWRRVIDGFDLLIVIPELTPSDVIR